MPDQDVTTVHLKDGTTLHLKGAGLSPEQVQAKVSAFRATQQKQTAPQEVPDANKQAQEEMKSLVRPVIPGTGTVDPTGGGLAAANAGRSPGYNQYMKESGRMGMETAGAMAGGALVAPLLPAAEAGGGSSMFLKWLLKALTKNTGMGVGAGAGAVAGGASPREAAETAVGTTAGGTVLEGLGTIPGKVAKGPVGRFAKDLMKSKVTQMEEKAAVEAAEAEKLYQKQLAEHKVKVQKVKEDYAAKIQEHSVEAKTASAKQSAAAAKAGVALEHQNQLSGLLRENLQLADKKISSELGKEFDAVSDAVQKKNPRVKVNDAEREARGKLYFPDSVSAFNNIMENVSGKLKMSDYGILRKTYSNLNDVLYGAGEMPDDLYSAIKTVRDSLGKDLQSAANQAGLGGKYSKAMREWSQYKDTWANKSSIAKGGSPIKKILDSEDPAFVADQLKGKAGDRLLEDIGKYQKYGADKALAGRLKGFIEQVRAMPSSGGAIPEAPKRPELPKAPERPETKPFDRDAAARQHLIDLIKKAVATGAAGSAGALGYEWLKDKRNPH